VSGIQFLLNGKNITTDVEADKPLLWVLREEFQLTGTKFGCGIAQCGACTVHLDGQAVRACVIPISAVAGREVVTIEGSTGTVADAVRTAWRGLDVVQCGYCQSGQIMSATALLAGNNKPTDDDIDGAMSGNLCRCGTYMRIRAAIHLSSESLERQS
jgi:isoquinoline 1-oxidoreductase alpha subunit